MLHKSFNRPFVILIMLILFLNGCTVSNVSTNHNLNPEQEAIIVFSVTQTDDIPANAMFYLDSRQDGFGIRFDQKRIEISNSGWSMSLSDNDFENDDELFGRVVVMVLEPGKHSLDSWAVNVGGGYLRPKNNPNQFELELKPGEIRYLGNWHMNLQAGENLFGMTRATGAVPEIRHEFERDFAIFKLQYPQFAQQIENKPFKAGLWLQEEEPD